MCVIGFTFGGGGGGSNLSPKGGSFSTSSSSKTSTTASGMPPKNLGNLQHGWLALRGNVV